MLGKLDEFGPGEELAWEPTRIVPPGPWVGHIPFAYWLIKALRPSTFVELGTHSGNSYFAFCQAIAAACPGSRAFAVDTWQGDEHAGTYGEEVFADVSQFNSGHFAQFSTLLRTTFDDARGYFPDAGVDLLHIDGMHSYEAVLHDFETWLPTLSGRGVVVFHDTNVRERGFGVWRLWQELSARYPAFEFSHSNGLGVLGVGADQAPAMQALFDLSPDEAAGFRREISARGEAFQRQVEVAELREHLDKKEAQIADLARRVEAATAEAETRVQAAEGATETARAGLAWQEALLASRSEVIAAKDAQIATVSNLAAARAAALETRDALILSRDALASRLAADLRHQRQEYETRLRLESEEREAVQAALRDRLAHGESPAVSIDTSATQQKIRAAMDAYGLEVAQRYVTSTSWRLTRPLRVASRLLKGQGLRPPVLSGPVPEPAHEAPDEDAPPSTVPALVQAPAPNDVMAVTPLKAAMRGLLMARLQAFLAGTAMLRLPRAEQPDVSIILVLYNQVELTFGCLGSIIETLSASDLGVEVIILDNASSDLTGALLDRIEGATIIRSATNLHFLKGVNRAAGSASGRTILLLNNDAQLLPGAVEAALRTLDSAPDIGAVGGRIILPDGTLQEAGSIVWRDGVCTGYGRGQDPNAPDYMFQRDVDYCSGAFLLTSMAAWQELGGFDERFAPAYYEETDYCLRLWESGRRVVFDPDATIIHYEFGSSGGSGDALALQAANHGIFAQQHRAWLEGQFPASPANVIAARIARSAAPRVLVLEDRVPKTELGAGYPRSNQLLHALVEAGAQVALFPMNRHAETWNEVHRALDKRIEVLIAADRTQLRAYLEARRGHFAAIIICRPTNMVTFDEAVGADRELIAGATIIYDAEALFVTRDLQKLEAEGNPPTEQERHRMIAAEVALTRLADAVVSVSPGEQATFETYGAKQVELLGHAIEDETLTTGFEERDQIVFLGGTQSDDAPNTAAVLWFAKDILPTIRQSLGEAFRLTLIGQAGAPSLRALESTALDLAGVVDDLGVGLTRARVMVVPSRLGAGIPLKILHGARIGVPMVATSLVAGQLGWRDGVELLVADDPTAFARACIRLYTDAALWEEIRRNALDRVNRDYAPEAFAARVRAIVEALPASHPMAASAAAAPVRPAVPIQKEAPNTSRPAKIDFSLAIPFGFAPLAAPAPRLAVICHLFHPDIAAEMRGYLDNLPLPADVFLSTDTEAKAARLRTVFAGWPGGTLEIRITPNRGRDIAPKLIGFADAYANYDLVLHLHSKVSAHAGFLAPWRSFLLENLLGSQATVSSILDAFARLPDLGMVAAQHYEPIRRWIGWNGNYDTAKGLAARMGITLSPRRALDFPSGSMFWARPAALKPLLDLKLSFEEFPQEGAQLDHTPAHAIERLYFLACERSGHTWLKIADPALYLDTSTIVDVSKPADLTHFVTEHGVLLTGLQPVPVAKEPAALVTRVPPGLALRLAKRGA
ncbi:glycosyl transferase family 2 [Humitalea rosea]|uniref:Glycosyl transferase family 2 n=1 Tax=Humitalea rosea TaxID=990373 RepID=A0A2W7KKG3_9PROT|nr:rhamnan synthesis F family protein [Humitalea rosea]PZW48635.1 glycosyl transferase family 2 [Humitalea rosea]